VTWTVETLQINKNNAVILQLNKAHGQGPNYYHTTTDLDLY